MSDLAHSTCHPIMHRRGAAALERCRLARDDSHRQAKDDSAKALVVEVAVEKLPVVVGASEVHK